MQLSLDGMVYYTGHKVLVYKDGSQHVSLSVADDKNEPYNIFAPGNAAQTLASCKIGDPISLVFDVRQWQNTLSIRCKEVIV